MLGVIGFLVAAVVVGAFVVSFRRAYPQIDDRTMQSFSTAFTILAIVMLVCASTFMGDQNIAFKILVVDVLMLVATGFMLDVIFKLNHPLLIVPLSLIMASLVAARAYTYPPMAYVDNGLLHFNLEGGARVLLLGIILLVWLPAAIIAATRALTAIKTTALNRLFTLAYVTLVLVTATFFSARQEVAIITTFATMIFIFAALTVANLVVRRYAAQLSGEVTHGK